MRRILFLLVFLLPACTREIQANLEFEVLDAKKRTAPTSPQSLNKSRS